MSDAVHIQVLQQFPVNELRLRRAAETVLARLPADSRPQLTIVVADNATVQQLNLEHRQLDCTTDVLSFPAGQMPNDDTYNGVYLGDVIIAYPYTKGAADRTNVDIENTLCMLVVHGSLHLLGYDHDTNAARKEMWEAQAAALASMGIDPAIVRLYGS